MAFGDWELIPLQSCGGDLGDPLDFIGVAAEITDREGYPTWQSFFWDGVRQPFVDIDSFSPLNTTTAKRHGWTCRMNNGGFAASKVYAQPAGVTAQSQYVVAIQDEASFVYTSGLGKFTSFEMGGSGGIRITVNTDTDYSAPVIKPAAANITVTRTAPATYTFVIPTTGQYSFEPTSDPTPTGVLPLYLFANTPEYFPPLASTSTIRVLTPGVWSVDTTSLIPVAGVSTGTAGEYTVNADRRLHISGGAYLRGKIKIGSNTDGGANANNGTVTGYGIVDATAVSDRARPLRINNSDNVIINGPTFLGQKSWACAVRKSTNCKLLNVKVIAWLDNDNTGTPDGIDLVASTGCEIGYSFIRSYDDASTVKSSMDDNTWQGAGGSHTIHDLVIFQGPAGNALEIGWESAQTISNVAYSNIVIIHKYNKTPTNDRDAISIYNRDGGAISNISYSNILVEQCQERYIGLQVVGGSLTGVTMNNVTFAGAPTALPVVITGAASHLVNNVAFTNLYFNGGSTKITNSNQLSYTTNAYATNVTFA